MRFIDGILNILIQIKIKIVGCFRRQVPGFQQIESDAGKRYKHDYRIVRTHITGEGRALGAG